jgi:hypothetical protein
MAKKKSSGPGAGDEATFRARLEAAKGESTLQLLFKAARLLDERALEARGEIPQQPPQFAFGGSETCARRSKDPYRTARAGRRLRTNPERERAEPHLRASPGAIVADGHERN